MPAARPPAETLATPLTQKCHPRLLYKMTPATNVGLPGTPRPRSGPTAPSSWISSLPPNH